MGVGHEEGGNHVLFLGLHARHALTAAFLGAEIGQRGAFDVAARCDGHDHVFTFDQVFVVHVAGPVDNLGAARHGEQFAHFAQFVRDDAHDAVAAAQNLKVFLDLAGQLFQFVRDFLDADLGQTLQAQLQNGAGLRFGQVIGAVVVGGVGRIVDQRDVIQDRRRGPAACHQLFARFGGVGGGPDGGHDFVDVGDGHGQTTQDVAAFAGLAQQIGGAARHDILAEVDKAGQEPAQGQLLGSAAVQRQHVTAEIDLHRGKAEQLVQHYLGGGVAFQFHDNPYAVAVGFVLNVRDAFDPFFACGLGDAFDHRGLVHLIGDLVDDDGKAVLADLLDAGLGADDDAAAPLKVGFARAGPAQHGAAGGKVWAGHIVDQLLGGQVGVFDQRQRGIDNLAQIVRRDVGGHADRNAARAVDQHVREARRQNGGFFLLAVIVVLEIDCFLVDVGQQVGGGLVHAHFGIAHGGGVIAVHRAKVALTVQQRQRHREILCHPHQRVINRAVAVRVILTHHIAHGTGGLAVGFVVRVAGFVHRKQDAPVHRFQPVTQIGDGAADDDRHGVIQIGCAHLVFDGDRRPRVNGTLRRHFIIVLRCFWRVVHLAARLFLSVYML